MNLKTQNYLKKLHEMYDGWTDQDFIMALAEVENDKDRAIELSQLADHPFILKLKETAIQRYKIALEHLVNRETAMRMSDEERAYTFATMEWAQFTLDILGESSEAIEKSIDEKVLLYARKAGIA